MEVIEQNGDEAFPPLVRPRLPRAVQERMVILFAQFQGVSAVRDAIKAEFGVELDKRDVAHYDVGTGRARVGKRLKQLYQDMRAAYVERSASVGVAHQAHRLRLLERVIEKAEKARDFANAIKGLELAAKEMGGTLTNVSKQEVRGHVEVRHLSIEDARAELAMRLSAVIDGGTLTPLPSPDPEPKPLEIQDNPTDLT